jgi:hypothetical protein
MMKKSNDVHRKASAIAIISSMLLLTGIMIPFEKANASPPFNIKDFKIVKFGVKNHNPFVLVQGIPGRSKGDVGQDFELGYIFNTDKGKFGAFSEDPHGPLLSSHFTQKNVNGHICLDNAHRAGHVVIDGHTLTIKGIHIDKTNKVSTERSIIDFDTGKGVFNCVDKIFDSKSKSW